MISIYDILQEFNKKKSTNYKKQVLIKYQNNDLLIKILEMTYDLVRFNYGVGQTTLEKLDYEFVRDSSSSIPEVLDILENEFCSKKVTGNAAIARLQETFNKLNAEDRYVISKLIERDLRINLGKTQINKVISGLIIKPAYERCDTYSDKTAKNINFPAFQQLKADGTYREFTVQGGNVTCRSRSGERYVYPIIFKQMTSFQNGVYIGELTVRGISDRAIGNGLINSDNPPHEDIVVQFWDYILQEEYNLALEKDRKRPCTISYKRRFEKLKYLLRTFMGKNIQIIPTKIVNNLQEAIQYNAFLMNKGFEGTVLKDFEMVFKDGTSKQQLKLKLEIDLEMRIVGFKDGRKGTKREGKIGSILFENDDRTIRGACSGMSDDDLDYFTENKDKILNKIMTVQCNDLSKAKKNDYYALSHPRFIEIRNDKTETDSLEKAFEIRQMVIDLNLKEISAEDLKGLNENWG